MAWELQQRRAASAGWCPTVHATIPPKELLHCSLCICNTGMWAGICLRALWAVEIGARSSVGLHMPVQELVGEPRRLLHLR